MKTSEISKLNETITKFIVEMSGFEGVLLTEAPDVWEPILLSLSTLSNVTTFLEAVKYHSAEEDVAFFNSVLKANNMPPLSGLKLEKYINKERDIDLNMYKPSGNSKDGINEQELRKSNSH